MRAGLRLAHRVANIKDRTMKLLSRWFRRAPSKPSWIEPVALAVRIEGDAALLVLDVRGPDEFTGPLGHIREAKNLPLNELPTQLSDLVRDSGRWSWCVKPTGDH